MSKGGTIYLDPETYKRLTRRYFLILGRLNVAYLEDEAHAFFLDKKTGEWIADAFTWTHVNGIGGDSDCEEISERQARNWVTESFPDLEVDWS